MDRKICPTSPDRRQVPLAYLLVVWPKPTARGRGAGRRQEPLAQRRQRPAHVPISDRRNAG